MQSTWTSRARLIGPAANFRDRRIGAEKLAENRSHPSRRIYPFDCLDDRMSVFQASHVPPSFQVAKEDSLLQIFECRRGCSCEWLNKQRENDPSRAKRQRPRLRSIKLRVASACAAGDASRKRRNAGRCDRSVEWSGILCRIRAACGWTLACEARNLACVELPQESQPDL